MPSDASYYTDGCLFCPDFSQGGEDLVNGGMPTFFPDGSIQNNLLVSTSLDNGGAAWPISPNIANAAAEVTMCAVARPFDTSRYAKLFLVPYRELGWQAPYNSLFMGGAYQFNQFQVTRATASNYYDRTFNTGTFQHRTATDPLGVYVVTITETETRYYLDGALVDTRSGIPAADFSNAVHFVALNRQLDDPGDGIQGEVAFLGVWDYAMTATEANDLAGLWQDVPGAFSGGSSVSLSGSATASTHVDVAMQGGTEAERAKPSEPATFDKTQLDPTYEAIYDKALSVIPFWQGATVEDLKTGAQGTIVDGPGDGLGPNWGTDAVGDYLEWPDTQTTEGRYVDFDGTAITDATFGDYTVVLVCAPLNHTVSDDGNAIILRGNPGYISYGPTDDAGQIGTIRHSRSGANVYSALDVTDGQEHVTIGWRSGTTIGVNVDGVETTGTADGDSFTVNQAQIGDQPGSTEQYVGKVYAVYLFDQDALTAAERQALVDDPYGLFRTEAVPVGLAVETANWSTTDTELAAVPLMEGTASELRMHVYSDSGHTTEVATAGPVGTLSDMARLSVSGLSPNTTYYVRFSEAGIEDTNFSLPVTTQPAPGVRSMTLALGNCSDTASNADVYTRIAAHAPDLMIQSGDWHYVDGTTSDAGFYAGGFQQALEQPNQSALWEAVPAIYTPDDHGNPTNDSDANTAGRAAAQESYRRCFPHLSLVESPAADTGALYFSRLLGRLRVIAMDLRSERLPASNQMISSAQMAWVKSEIDAAKAQDERIALISSVPWVTEENAYADDWSAYPAQRQEITDYLVQTGMAGATMILSGDQHSAAFTSGFDYSTSGGGAVPVLHAGALSRAGSVKGGPYEQGAFPGSGQYGIVDITDTGGASVNVQFRAFDSTDAEIVAATFTLDAPTVERPLTATVGADTQAQVQFAVERAAEASAQSYTAAEMELAVQRLMTGVAQSGTTVQLDVLAERTLTAIAGSETEVNVVLAQERALQVEALSQSTAQAETHRRLALAFGMQSEAQAQAQTGRDPSLTASVNASADASARLMGEFGLAAEVMSPTNAQARLTVQEALDASATAVGQAKGRIYVHHRLKGLAASDASLSLAFYRMARESANVTAETASDATLALTRSLTADASSQTGATGYITEAFTTALQAEARAATGIEVDLSTIRSLAATAQSSTQTDLATTVERYVTGKVMTTTEASAILERVQVQPLAAAVSSMTQADAQIAQERFMKAYVEGEGRAAAFVLLHRYLGALIEADAAVQVELNGGHVPAFPFTSHADEGYVYEPFETSGAAYTSVV